DFEALCQSHIRIPNTRRFDRVQTDVAASAGLCVLQDDISLFVSDSLQSAGRSQAWINCQALRIRNFLENVAEVISGVRAGCPLDAARSVEIERSYLVRSSEAIEHVSGTNS